MSSEKSQNVQDVFLNHVRKNKTPVTVFLVNGVKLQGIITWFDNFCVLLRRDAHSQLVYKHAISTVMPAQPIQLFEGQGRRRSLIGWMNDASRRRPARSGAVSRHSSGPAARAAASAARPRAPRGRLDEAVGACARDRARRRPRRRSCARAAWRPATLLGSGAGRDPQASDRGPRRSRVVVDRCAADARCSSAISRRPGTARSSTAPASSSRSSARAPAPHEGRLQVELAALTYQRSRLVRSWTHLERQRGGFGFLGGPGESQLEIDRRLIDRAHRHAQERARGREAHPRAPSRGAQARAAIRSWRWSATPMPASRRCSIA